MDMMNHRPTVYFGRILLGEISLLLASMRRSTPRWSSNQQDDEKDPLVCGLRQLQMTINHLGMGEKMDPNEFLNPFLVVIRSEDTTGPVTKSALAAVNRMLTYGLIDPSLDSAPAVVEAVASAVTHARFVGTDHGADEVVLWEILTVLRTLILGPVGHLLTNESVCEILNSSFRICFETRLSELLRNCTEDALRHMVQLLFGRLPQFKDEPQHHKNSRKLKMRAGCASENKIKRGKNKNMRSSPSPPNSINLDTEPVAEQLDYSVNDNVQGDVECTINNERARVIDDEPNVDSVNLIKVENSPEVANSVDSETLETLQSSLSSENIDISYTHLGPDEVGSMESLVTVPVSEQQVPSEKVKSNILEEDSQTTKLSKSDSQNLNVENVKDKVGLEKDSKDEFFNCQGVKFTTDTSLSNDNDLLPYGLPCVKEVFRFLVSLTSLSNEQNTPTMISTALNLLTVALEIGSEYINQSSPLLPLVRDQLCCNALMLLKVDAKPHIFMASLRVCTLLFESLRIHLKFQLEMFINKLIEIILSDSAVISYSFKELSLETIVQLWRVPGLITELYLNFDCNLYASDIFENLTKMLSQNAFPVQGLYSTNFLSLDALLTVVEMIDSRDPPDSKRKSRNLELDNFNTRLPLSKSLEMKKINSVSSNASNFENFLISHQCGAFSPILKARAMLVNDEVIDREIFISAKEKKKLVQSSTDQFNIKPEKGLQFLQEHNLLGTSNSDIVSFLRENPHLDKTVLGEYLSKKKNVDILFAFVRSFDFKELRIDQCLRMFLEAFRLPGEAPVIGIIIEHFSSHWHESNGCPFNKEDAAFTLAYAVIMLNVDQHNANAKKQNIPMTLDQFRNNVRGVNDGKDFDQKMLEEIYNAIVMDEIVMPAEQTGFVKEKYFWKLLLKRGNTEEGRYILANSNYIFDKDLFTLCWGPTIASLSYFFDKSTDEVIIRRAIGGFKRCASISAKFGMSDVFDNLVLSLIKFTCLVLNPSESPQQIAISFGTNNKAQLAARSLFYLVTSFGDNLKDGWKNMCELLLQLFRCGLLPQVLVESEDFLAHSGRVSLIRATPEQSPRVETGIFSSLYSYISMGDGISRTTAEDELMVEKAKGVIVDCHIEKLITESAFLRYDSLNELIKSIICVGMSSEISSPPNSPRGSPEPVHGTDEHSQSFLLELIVAVLIANKDRAGGIWPLVRDHVYSLLMGAVALERTFLMERCIVSLLKVSKVLLRRPELANPILQSLRVILVLRSQVLSQVSLQIIAGIHEVLAVNADHILEPHDWAVLFALLECAGAGAKSPQIVSPTKIEELPSSKEEQALNSEGITVCVDSGIESSEATESCSLKDNAATTGKVENTVESQSSRDDIKPDGLNTAPPDKAMFTKSPRIPSPETVQGVGGWIMVGKEGEIEPLQVRSICVNEWDIVHQRILGEHHPSALVRAVDTLSFLVREQHVTAASLPSCVAAFRTFVEATLNGGKSELRHSSRENALGQRTVKSPNNRRNDNRNLIRRNKALQDSNLEKDTYDSDPDESQISYQQVSEKLLDLMDTLHSSSSHIFELPRCNPNCQMLNSPCIHSSIEASSNSLWSLALCPLLQGIARYCCDTRPSIRNLAMTYLQRALLNHDLQALKAHEWESCFNKILFPLLSKLLNSGNVNSNMYSGMMEETRVRAATLVQKVYLRHLGSLLTLPTFTALWLTIIDFMDKYLNTDRSDNLGDAIPEILKNMLLVMETTQVFHTNDGFTRLWSITWDRIDAFLPHFRNDLFRTHPPSKIHCIELGANSEIEVPVEPVNTVPEIINEESLQKEEKLSSSTVLNEISPKLSTEMLSLKDQEAAVRLSLSQEDIPSSVTKKNIILQPPLPHLPSDTSKSAEGQVLSCDEANTTKESLSEFNPANPTSLECYFPESNISLASPSLNVGLNQDSCTDPIDEYKKSNSYDLGLSSQESSEPHSS